MIRRPPRSTLSSSSAASDVYKRQYQRRVRGSFDGVALMGMEKKKLSGYLEKKKHQKSFGTPSYVKRWYVLKGDTLSYFDNENSAGKIKVPLIAEAGATSRG
eukprot:TRINITY_DN3448_c0_g1_i4.p4 TRINITY_DN3448_c0_g1~~TRINITY_DN3448_c0_g1_i4.p4  ORF type:complete len:102 (-),score=37.65 TRINITY_DN3448_c0_g1_i4:992-1297(-)